MIPQPEGRYFQPIREYAAKSLVVSDSVRPHRQQPTRLPCPWGSPGKNTGVGYHCLLRQTMSTIGHFSGLKNKTKIKG